MCADETTSRISGHAHSSRLGRGAVLGRYVVDAWVRDGGMASLYRGHHSRTRARVAIKVQGTGKESREVISARFEREAEVMGRLAGNRSVAQVHDLAELSDGRRYLVMEWVAGTNLEELLDRLRDAEETMPLPRACRLLLDVAHGLAAAHERGVVHRDLSLSNIMIEQTDCECAKLIDFGISADLDAAPDAPQLTATGLGLGTSGYMAPEQALGLPAHPGFDLYAFGIVSFEVLTGLKAPPSGRGPRRLPSVEEYRSSVPAVWSTLIAECLDPDPKLRPSSADEVIARLQAVGRMLGGGCTSAAVESPAPGAALPSSGEGMSPEHEAASGRDGWRIALVAVVILGIALVWRCVVAPPVIVDNGEVPTVTSANAPDTSSVGVMPSGAPVGTTSGGLGSSSASTGTQEPSSTGALFGGADAEPASETRRPAERPPRTRVESEGRLEANAPEDPTEPRPPTRPSRACQQTRDDAQGALRGRQWTAILEHTTATRCWSSRDQRILRTTLRVKALVELGRYRACVDEGAGSIEPSIARVTRLCRSQLDRAETG